MTPAFFGASAAATMIGVVVIGQAADGTPTTIVGAFIIISLAMSSLVGLVVKKLLDDAREDRAKFSATLSEIEKGNQTRSEAEDARIAALIKATDERWQKQRELYETQQERQRTLYESQQDKQQQFFDRKLTDLLQMNLALMKEFRTAVHDVKDTASAATNTANRLLLQQEREEHR